MDNIEQLFRLYFKDVFLYLRAISRNEDIAEELTQETFFKALKSIHKFRGECDIRVWLCQIAKNTYYSYGEKNRKEILEEMEEPYRKVFHLRVFGELSFRKIGEAFGRTENWARVTYYRARCSLAKEMEDKYGRDEL